MLLLQTIVANKLLQAYFVFFVTFGLYTSLLNHSSTLQYARPLDRAFMRFAFVSDICLTVLKPNPKALVLIVCSGSAYIASKISENNGFYKEPLHVLSHCLITSAHIEMFRQYTLLDSTRHMFSNYEYILN
jgi:hypothetical protein